ncbi:MAG TPA: ABC transporter ATP-binding protein [Gemmatimonadales bacterium]|jgi:Cu-processing system ATP-binding protein
MITLHRVSKRFGRTVVLQDASADIRAGRITAMIGPNGAGKTTLLKLILGLATPDRGTIRVGGHLLDGSPDYRDAIGYVPQIVRFPQQLTGRELLATFAALRPRALKPDLSLAAAFGVTDALDRPLGLLSGGTRQKINTVLGFAFRPQLLILDEPTAGLDPVASRALKNRLIGARTAGATVLITSHLLTELEELVDDIVFLADGSIQWEGSVEQLEATTGQCTLERAVDRLWARPSLQAVA